MVNKKETMIWILYAALLVVLFLASSTDLIIKEQKTEVYQLSVIIEDSRDENYTNFRKVMDQAAMELNADVSFITLYEPNNLKQQIELLMREKQDGAGALVVSPVDDAALVDAVSQNKIDVPVVFVNAEMTGGRIAASISPDYVQMGKQLADVIGSWHEKDVPVYLFGEAKRDRITKLFESGVRSGMEAAGYRVTLFEKRQEGEYRRTIEQLVYPGCEHGVIVALDQAALVETAAVLADSSVYTSYVEGLYGRGTSLTILNDLDRGLIKGVCVTDDFAAGYCSVKMAVELMTNQSVKEEEIWQESYYIEKSDLHRPEFEKMLYPIE